MLNPLTLSTEAEPWTGAIRNRPDTGRGLRIREPLLLVAAILLVSPVGARSQGTTMIERADAGDCNLQLREVTRLGRLADPVGFHPLSDVAVSSTGTIYVASALNRGEIAVYDSTGEYSGVLGGYGDGPGEFTSPVKISVLEGDSLFAVEGVSGRMSLFSPEGDVLRTGRLPAPVHDYLLREDGTIVTSAPYGEGHVTEPLQIVAGTGVRAAFGSTVGEDGAENLKDLLHEVAPGPDGGILSARIDAYRIVQWSRDGGLVRRWAGDPEGIPWDYEGDGAGVPNRAPPPSRTLDLRLDSDGRAWILTAVADKTWTPVEQGKEREAERVFDTVIDVIDLATGNLVCSERMDPLVQVTRDGKYFYAVEMAAEGLRRVMTVWRGELHLN